MTALPVEEMESRGPDEAQALITAPPSNSGSRMERIKLKDGVVQSLDEIFVPAQFYSQIEGAAVEELTIAKDAVINEYPTTAANFIVDRLVKERRINRDDATYVRNLVELEIRRGIEHVTTRAHDGLRERMPVTTRSLIPLITRSVKR